MSDKPEHILEIPDSLGRDIDRGLQPPIEAFMSDTALQQAQDATSAGPVHAESLVPISKAEAARLTTGDGQHLIRAPRTRRVIPAPYRRDRVTGGSHGKQWVTLRADYVRSGDIVPGTGRIIGTALVTRREAVAGRADVPVGINVVLTGAGGIETILDAAAEVRAFRAPAGSPDPGAP